MLHFPPPAPLARVTAFGDYFEDVELEDSTNETRDVQSRADLVASIAADKLKDKLQWLTDIDLIGGIQSAELAQAADVRRAYLIGDAALGALVRKLIVSSMTADADTEAEEVVRLIERDACEDRELREDRAPSHPTFRITGGL
ncbi:hypothetical protein BC1002_6521 [Paraburkholderia atlantica]|uniref:Uncharacterized protein n=1 Tax=Paraburkholderia atlantica TaxID=2654982 RepID=D5WMB7_PARAM|nr:hypothetical protein [Paraburkholderia atlantica]ADG20363.1 hypothetical protein BC1002_6521 [Paraburkholderia atlantica]